ncbi:MAG TPA: ammonium transporter [Solirubrobacterales bacterium]|nr:ammonium transporter [Solirubrobacterales bacterium]
MEWLSEGANSWQLTAATLVGLMSIPGLVVLYGGVMQKRWSVNSMMMAFVAFAIVLILWVLVGFKMGFGEPVHIFGASSGFFGNFIGKPESILNSHDLLGQAHIPELAEEEFLFPQSTLAYFQIVFAAITPILMLGSVLGRFNFKAWIPFVALWTLLIYTVNAFMIWGGGFFAQQGSLDFSGGYVIHLAAGISGFVAAAVIGPRLQRDREIDAPNNLAMVAVGAGLLWMGWNGFNGGDWYSAGEFASAAVLNTNLCTAVAFLVWVGLDYATGRKPSLIGSVNGMIVGLVAITPAAGFVNGWAAIIIGVIASAIVYFALNYLSRVAPFRNVDDTLGVVYTHGFAGLCGGLLTGIFANKLMAGEHEGLISGGGLHLLWVQAYTAAWVIAFSAIGTFILLKIVGLVVPLRMTEAEMETGDIAVHGHEVYPSDVPSLGYPDGIKGAAPSGSAAPAAGSA